MARCPRHCGGCCFHRLHDNGQSAVFTEESEGGLSNAACIKHYRERADAENIIDEIKNQWGWSGYTTQKIGHCRIMAMFSALIYNWWHLYVRFYDETHNREAITSRPALMQGVGRRVESGGQKRIRVSILHQKADVITAVSLCSKSPFRESREGTGYLCSIKISNAFTGKKSIL